MYLLASAVANIKTACLNKVASVKIKRNNQIIKLCQALEDLGYIYGFSILNNYSIRVFLKYRKNKSVIRGLNLFSKPSSRVYLKKKNFKGIGTISRINKHAFTLFNNSRTNFLLTDIEMLMLGIGGEPVVTVS